MKPFEYRKPESLAEAVALLGGRDDAVAMAGGMTLLPTMKQRLAEPAEDARVPGGQRRTVFDDGRATEQAEMRPDERVALDQLRQRMTDLLD